MAHPDIQPGAAPDFAAELNPQQLAAVTSGPGPALVIAGAGSGKTRTLTYRVAWLLANGVPPWGILLLTFTNKAAREMLGRVVQLVPAAAEGIWGGTFHSIGNRILRRHAHAAGLAPGFSILDREDSENLIDSVAVAAGLRGREANFPKAGVLADMFSLCANTGLSVRRLVEIRHRYFHRIVPELEQLQTGYESRKRENNSADFDDLLVKTVALFEMHPEILAGYQRRFHHVLVDEFQDTNLLQARLVDQLAGAHGNLMVVGDDAQSIYSWRGADCANILEFPKRYPGTKVFKIETNYRSVPGVLELANAAIAANPVQFEKKLSAVRPVGARRPAGVVLATNNEQAAFVAARVLALADAGIPFEEMAVLYRAHFHSMEVQLEFTRRGIPFAVNSGLRFFEQAHIKDVAAYMKLCVNPRDETAFTRMARMLPGIGGKTAAALWQQFRQQTAAGPRFERLRDIGKIPARARKEWEQLVHTLEEMSPPQGLLPPAEMIRSVLLAGYAEYLQLKFTNYENRLADLETLESYAREFATAEDFLAQLALLATADTPERAAGAEGRDRVTLTSIHQAKGLEWRVVFLIWLADGMFPGSRSLDNPAALAEERRLFYVGITRCKDELYLTHPEMRLNASYTDSMQRPSRFLTELPAGVLEPVEVDPGCSGVGRQVAQSEPSAAAPDVPF